MESLQNYTIREQKMWNIVKYYCMIGDAFFTSNQKSTKDDPSL